MKRILIEIDERFITEWGFIYFGVRPGPEGLELFVPDEPACLPGFKYVKSPEANGSTFRISDVDVLEKRLREAQEAAKDDPSLKKTEKAQ